MKICAHCDEEITPPERMEPLDGDELQMHRECWLRRLMGSVLDQCGACDCADGDNCDDENLTTRENAKEAAAFFFSRTKRAATVNSYLNMEV